MSWYQPSATLANVPKPEGHPAKPAKAAKVHTGASPSLAGLATLAGEHPCSDDLAGVSVPDCAAITPGVITPSTTLAKNTPETECRPAKPAKVAKAEAESQPSLASLAALAGLPPHSDDLAEPSTSGSASGELANDSDSASIEESASVPDAVSTEPESEHPVTSWLRRAAMPKRAPSFWAPVHEAPNWLCASCGGSEWWSRPEPDRAMPGQRAWCCSTCHPTPEPIAESVILSPENRPISEGNS